MEPVGRPYDAMPHEAVVSNLLDLQARLRGDPASMVVPRVGRPTASRSGGGATRRPRRVGAMSNPTAPRTSLVAQTQDAEERIEALRRRLQFLELEIDAYEHVGADASAEEPQPVADANVIDLQQAVERRLTQD